MTESQIILTKHANRIDPTIRSQAMAFFQKLAVDDANPGIHIEPLHGVADSRVRTGRINLAWRAVLFQMDAGGQRAYIVHGVWHHDEAIERAKRARVKINPINGIPEINDQATAAQVTVDADPGSPPPTTPADAPTLLGHSAQELIDSLGLPAEVAEQAARCTSEDELLALANRLDNWQGLALLDLATGKSVEDVRTDFQLDDPGADDSTEAILEKIRTNPSAQTLFTYVDGADELRQAIEGGDFGAWRTWLHPTQRRLVDRDYNGSYRLAGGAGTGKTVVLLHRARRLAYQNPEARILLTTFTTNLAEQMRENLLELDPNVPLAGGLDQPGVHVIGIDALARAVVNRMPTIDDAAKVVFGVAGDRSKARIKADGWSSATAKATVELPTELRSTSFVQAEYESVVLPLRIVDPSAYAKAPRPGRGVRLGRPQRIALWGIFADYRATSLVEGTIDFAEIAALAAEAADLAADGAGRLFDHVLVDEGQDLGPCHLQLIRSLVAEGPNDVFLAEDSHQRIYGQRLVLSRYGLHIRGRSSRLKVNYRTTAENLALARTVLQGVEWVDADGDPEDSSGYRSLRSGPAPRVRQHDSLVAEYDAAAELLRHWLDTDAEPETMAVLVRDRKHRDQVVAALDERGVHTRSVEAKKIPPGLPVVLTMHRSKGTEFARVLLLGVSERNLPASFALRNQAPEDRAEAMLRERSLLYVAASRARDELVVSYSGKPSPLLPG